MPNYAQYHQFLDHLDQIPLEDRSLLTFGFGYAGSHLAAILRDHGWRIGTTSRTQDKVDHLRAEGIDAYLFDPETGLMDADGVFERYAFIMTSAPPDDQGDPVLRHHREDILAGAKKRGGYHWVGYLGTTGVYGDRQGGWVDETSKLDPSGPRGQKRKDAEIEWFSLDDESADALPVHSFRLAGIYGPGKSALETVKKGKARRVVKQGQVFSRIHLDDIVQILLASMAQPNGGAAYNCCDDFACPPQDVITYACDLLDVEAPPLLDFDSAELSPMARSFYGDNKKVDNYRIKAELGVRLIWPDYRDALDALHKEG